jgi:oxygen-dependent protoporphyrinogen oxidase
LVRGALAARGLKKKSGEGRPETGDGGGEAGRRTSVFLTPTTGLAEIVEALVGRLGEGRADLRLDTRVERVMPKSGEEPGYNVVLEGGERLEAEGVILATPAYVSGELLSGVDANVARELQGIPYVSTATVSLGFREEDLPRPLDGYGYVIPRREGRKALACTWTSTKFPHRAPEGYALLRVFVGRAGQEDQVPWDEAGLLEIAREELRLTLGITAEPVLQRAYIWERAMPQYNLGHPERLNRIEARLERLAGLKLAGNGYRGIGIPDCIHSGEEAAEGIMAALTKIP